MVAVERLLDSGLSASGRVHFGRAGDLLDMPNLLEIQKKSFEIGRAHV